MKNNHTCSGCDISSKALKEECGVFGVYNKDGGMDAAQTIYYGLYALQHRGQESCGIAVNDDGTIIPVSYTHLYSLYAYPHMNVK